jgi:hypothetical protein
MLTDVTQNTAPCATEQGSEKIKLKLCSVAHRTLSCVTSVVIINIYA